jgi:integrating conjugative element protein (TIGR03758 family)
MSMTDAQTAAFQNASGFSAQSSSTLWMSLVLVLALLWCAWVMWTAYRGWATGSALRAWRQRCACTAHLADFDVLHPVLTPEIAIMLKCLAPQKQPA